MDSTDDHGQVASHVTAGGRLRSAREAAGFSRSDIASRTKIAERHLLAIEENRFGDLAARAYAVGFARAYARALALDEAEIAALVRDQLDAEDVERPAMQPSFEPGDPARVPSVRVAWLSAGGAILVIALLLMFWSNFLSPEGKLPDLLPPAGAPAPVASVPTVSRPVSPQPVQSVVVLTATEDNIWLAVTDAAGTKLLERVLAKGESWTVPAGARAPRLRTGRPDALRLTVGGRPVPSLSDRPMTVSDISLVPADLLARANPAGPAVPARAGAATVPTPGAMPAPSPSPAVSSVRPRATGAPVAQPSRPASTPTARPVAKPAGEPAGEATPAGISAPGTAANAAARPPAPAQAVSTASE